ncbi:geranylgeranyl reductase family protein [Leptolyngbya sp. NIES-2104]|uniref:geranylgeranyl reductase family protein n=1 Tax=Leptolyngbya sp. NIES-2104 TaxID=1552121 RepID=UPI0006EC862B|nr:geranylgeranyl reductase family protein [Leptolyngbya sp. NIES-2104]GAP94592.1 geranylgeranyl diphosphate reductase [Leptolyngbya sp. NIES-2104]
MFDCIVVGAGPAGGTAAYHLAKRGRSVLVLEKEALPRYKPCSGGVSPAIAQWFDFDFAPVISRKVNTIRYTWKLGDPVDATLNTPEPMWMVRRDQFDEFLMNQAQQAGAKLQDATAVTGIEFKGDRWQVNTTSGTLEAKYLIAADGAKGPMAKWLGFKERKTRMGAVMEAPHAIGSTAQFDFGMLKNGFIWNLPKAEGFSAGTASFRGDDRTDFNAALSKYAKEAGFNTSGAQVYTHPIAFWDGDQTLHTQNAVLAGESASIVDPMTAEGIRPSMYSGMKAAEAIDQSLSGDRSALAQYTETIQRDWGSDMVWAQRLANLFYRVPGIGYKVGVKRPTATDRLGKIMCGELRYADVANRALKRLGGGLIPGMGG